MEDKQRLLDYAYLGAQGQGTIAWDDSLFYAEHDAGLIASVRVVLNKLNALEYEEALCSLCKRAVGFKQDIRDDYAETGKHRFGGYPDLPETIVYPRFKDNQSEEREFVYEFIAQINLKDIAHLQEYLPKTGMLYFFLTTHHDIGLKPCPSRVIWYDGEASLVSGKTLAFKEEDFYEVLEIPPYKGYKAKSFVMNSLPDFYSASQNLHWFSSEKTRMLKELSLGRNLPFEINDIEKALDPYDFAINSYMFTQHESPELQAAIQLKGNVQDWIVLLKVTSAGDFQWEDSGDLAFVIHKSDLAKKDFSQVFVTVESS